MSEAITHDEQIIAATITWLEKAVIGLNLCPFAKAVHVKHQIRTVVCHEVSDEELLRFLHDELVALADIDPTIRDTTLIALPNVFGDFLDFNDFLALADDVLNALELDGTLQIASFHPQFQFAGTSADDVSNYTNRSPYPTLHLIREASIDRAVASFPDASDIYERNIETLEKLGVDGWKQLFATK